MQRAMLQNALRMEAGNTNPIPTRSSYYFGENKNTSHVAMGNLFYLIHRLLFITCSPPIPDHGQKFASSKLQSPTRLPWRIGHFFSDGGKIENRNHLRSDARNVPMGFAIPRTIIQQVKAVHTSG
jgi:hypothetical protein